MSGPASAPPRVVFLGTPRFAVPSLRALAGTATVVGVVTQPDRPSGRGRVATAPPVAASARALGLAVLQPASLRSVHAVEALAALHPDLMVTVAYGRILPPPVLALPPLGCVNLHPSLLPAYRGPSPIQTAIADGAPQTGITVLYMTEALDAGDIIVQQEVAIGPEETAGELEERLAEVGAALLVDAVRLIARGEAPRTPQDHAKATFTRKFTKEDGLVRWERPAAALANMVRAMNPWPTAHTSWRGGLLKIWRARPGEGTGRPGTVLGAGEDGLIVATGAGALVLLEVQPEGGRRMPAAAFLRGHRLEVGEHLGDAS